MNLTVENKSINVRVNEAKADLFATAMLQRLGGEANYMKVMKLIYFAERYHIRKYMRPIANDDLLAMKKGMVGSFWLNILRGICQSLFFESDNISRAKIKNGFTLEETSVFSQSEIEALDFAINKFGKYDENQLVDIVHEYPEWVKYKGIIEKYGGAQRIEVDDILESPTNNPVFKANDFTDPFPSISTEEKEMIKEALADYAIESM